MNVYKKLMLARLELQSRKLKKSGLNEFAGYQYFELGDFLPAVQEIFAKHGLCGVITFGNDIARLTIVDTEGEGSIEVTSPMSTAALKGAHAIQNLGAVQTYIRRYLWVTAMEIVEHDALDSSKPVDKAPKHTPTGNPDVSHERMAVITGVATAIMDRMERDDVVGAFEEYEGITDPEEITALWKLLDAPTRRQIKEYGQKLATA